MMNNCYSICYVPLGFRALKWFLLTILYSFTAFWKGDLSSCFAIVAVPPHNFLLLYCLLSCFGMNIMLAPKSELKMPPFFGKSLCDCYVFHKYMTEFSSETT